MGGDRRAQQEGGNKHENATGQGDESELHGDLLERAWTGLQRN
jgi:hypothetical protein